MLTDVIVEEEFDRNEDELWYSRKDLEHDLHLAAELGKTLLDRNHELEQGLQQMYSTNHEQLQEIEYLTKQVDLLRQMNDQHAKVYEQLDLAARDLEKSNQRLVLENRTAQHRIQSLTETIDGLQTHMEGLQKQVDELKVSQSKRDLAAARRSLGAQSMSCLKEIYDLQQDKYLSSESLQEEKSWPALDDRHVEEENSTLQHTLHNLKVQLASERARRLEAERETELTAQENGALEERLSLLEGARRRQAELEAEVEELRQLWRSESSGARLTDAMLPDSVFFGVEEKVGVGHVEEEEQEAELPQGRRRCSSDSYVRGARAEDIRRGHERTCIRRAQAVKQRGISLLNEVDAQYSALQVKYEELLRRCQQGADSLSHKAVQTPTAPAQRRKSQATTTTDTICLANELHQPEYKALFKEIFTCIQKTKEDLSENRAGPSQ
ncbi:cerebellar degeneration-related protein 2-like [Carassius auratus]|uniref:Cerebellar degeneration-related protein 2-like n=1 Tax=Carassius auratus TaxID=7957 RepID=A0A6P6K0G9_CARAU|nr:cerebellar degeneration-related protein 2-like [Carassius auratus]XP_052408080.1 cerebellar degeneration-related protein 2 [Carassius gibelio]